jgi:hypothetical protein
LKEAFDLAAPKANTPRSRTEIRSELSIRIAKSGLEVIRAKPAGSKKAGGIFHEPTGKGMEGNR